MNYINNRKILLFEPCLVSMDGGRVHRIPSSKITILLELIKAENLKLTTGHLHPRLGG